MEWYYVAAATLAGVVLVKLLVLFVMGGGSFARLGLAYQAFGRTLAQPAFAEKVRALIQPPPPPPPPKKSGEALRLLTLLQRKGRLLDFLLEDIQGATNEQLGAGVRELHRESQAVLKEHLTLEPVLPQSEGDTVEAPPGFDPSAIRLTGNVTGQPPFRGVLKHHGWRVKDFTLVAPPEGQDEFVVAPAEVELP
jgi:Domain of unknown function (DUF2760)